MLTLILRLQKERERVCVYRREKEKKEGACIDIYGIYMHAYMKLKALILQHAVNSLQQ